jgi:hypothetical protein
MLAAAAGLTAALAVAAAGPAVAAPYPPPSIHLQCTAAPTSGTLDGRTCVLHFGQTTAPNAYSATIAATKVGAAGPTISFAVTAGGLPSGLAIAASSATSAAISGNPAQAGTFNFTVKATDGGKTSTLAYQITITVQGPPDQLVCTPAANGGFLIGGVCVLPDANTGLPYQGHLLTAHQAGGTLSIVSGSLPPGLTLPATFASAGDTVRGTPGDPGIEPNYAFTVQGTGDQGQPLYQAYSIMVDPDQPLTINSSGTIGPAMVGAAFPASFLVSGGAAPYTWSVASGQLPPGLSLQTGTAGPRDADNEFAGTPTTAGTYTFTIQVSDYDGQQATQQFTLIVQPPLQVTRTTLPTGTVGVSYSQDLDLIAKGGTPPYTWSIEGNIDQLPPGLTLDTTAPDFNNVVAGTPTQAGTYTFAMQVSDSEDNGVSATLTITINP